jgi:hypothetical protein
LVDASRQTGTGSRNSLLRTGHLGDVQPRAVKKYIDLLLFRDHCLETCHHREDNISQQINNGCALRTARGIPTAGLRPTLLLPWPSCRGPRKDANHAIANRPHRRMSGLQSSTHITQSTLRRCIGWQGTDGGVHEERSRTKGERERRGQQGASPRARNYGDTRRNGREMEADM